MTSIGAPRRNTAGNRAHLAAADDDEDADAAFTVRVEESAALRVAAAAAAAAASPSSGAFVVDSGATRHMSGESGLFTQLRMALRLTSCRGTGRRWSHRS